ncbi:Endonuclease 8-like 1 [Saguinus oedipus]|uniref:Endonuclease 8-like 1 n=1 Tax=Saguinus oedipus TaxID=9490 RepID=A0ABQ9V2T2_SAGOE|nr:Endonuclease 8-like 1 [Saguinus oedipus]
MRILFKNVLRNLSDKAFDRPICEALLDQRFFNGIGNYLRVEILYRMAFPAPHSRLKIPPFEKARSVLEALQQRRPSPELTLSQKIKAKLQNPDLLELCHSVPKEVVQLGEAKDGMTSAGADYCETLGQVSLFGPDHWLGPGKGYGSESGEEDFAGFRAWLRCYGMPGMSSLQDWHGRTIWFQGDPGPLAPKGGKSCKKKSKATQPSPEDGVEVWLPVPPPPPLYSCPGCPCPTSSSPVPLPCFHPPRQLPYPKRVGGVASPNQPLQSPLGTRASSIQDCPSRSKDPSRTRRAKRDLPERTATQRPEATSFQQDPEAPKIPKKGRRKGRQAASGQRRPRKAKADTPSLELEGTSTS